NYSVNAKKELENKEPWSPCDPSYVDQLIGGWMRAGDGITVKRRSPLSISAMRPIHPLLAGTDKENLTFDRSDKPERHPVNVRFGDKLMTDEEIDEFLTTNNRSLPRRNWIPDNVRTGGLFIYDIAIDLRTLFSVSTNQHEPELSKEKIADLKEKGWIESENVFGKCLVLPKEEREKVIPALANAILNWRITSNQARTFSLMETLAVAISDNANKLAGAIRAKLIEDGEKPKAKPIIDETAGADVFITLPCSSYVVTVNESSDALEKAKEKLIELMMNFDYENQLEKA
ncbi:MAG TPA: CRISPR-associated protein Cas7, partial [Bacteroidales bacterium]|nr:CRISPR-associated protein Cas7 [Bacteroidales bacterium]